jgi:DnaJ-class molecular chaperone
LQTLENHYATLGLDRRCTDEQIRAAYRLLAKQHHPDVNGGSADALARTQKLNAAYEILSDEDQRRDYDRELAESEKRVQPPRANRNRNLSQEVHLRLEEFFRGTQREVRIFDPGNMEGPELLELNVPPNTAVGTRLRLARLNGGVVVIRLKLQPHFQFKARGADLRCDLKISLQRASQGGEETVTGPTGARLRLKIPPHIARGEILRISGEGLPRPRGGRGDLLVRIVYRPQIRVTRKT